jgi:hypothetical protein
MNRVLLRSVPVYMNCEKEMTAVDYLKHRRKIPVKGTLTAVLPIPGKICEISGSHGG